MQKTSFFKKTKPFLLLAMLAACCFGWKDSSPHARYLITIFFTCLIGLNIGRFEAFYTRRLKIVLLCDFWNLAKIPPRLVEGDLSKLSDESRKYIDFYMDRNKQENSLSNKVGFVVDLLITILKGISIAIYLASIIAMAIAQEWSVFYLLWGYVVVRLLLALMLFSINFVCKMSIGRYPWEAHILREWLEDKKY